MFCVRENYKKKALFIILTALILVYFFVTLNAIKFLN
jgi:hypothetical protein